MCTACSIVSTLMVAVATLSVNKLHMIVFNLYTKFYRADTNGNSRNAKRKQIENYCF